MSSCISILGSTGSIGRQTLDVVDKLGLRVAALTANRDVDRLEAQCRKYRPKLAAMMDEAAYKELKARLREVSWNQSQVEDCSHYVVLCARRTATQRDVDRYLAQIEFTRHPSAEKLASSADFYTGYVKSLTPEKMHTWLDCQVYIAAGFLLSAAAALRVDSCTIGGMDRDKYDEILGLDGTPYRSVVSVALGYRAKDDDYAREAKVRFPAGEVIDIRA